MKIILLLSFFALPVSSKKCSYYLDTATNFLITKRDKLLGFNFIPMKVDTAIKSTQDKFNHILSQSSDYIKEAVDSIPEGYRTKKFITKLITKKVAENSPFLSVSKKITKKVFLKVLKSSETDASPAYLKFIQDAYEKNRSIFETDEDYAFFADYINYIERFKNPKKRISSALENYENFKDLQTNPKWKIFFKQFSNFFSNYQTYKNNKFLSKVDKFRSSFTEYSNFQKRTFNTLKRNFKDKAQYKRIEIFGERDWSKKYYFDELRMTKDKFEKALSPESDNKELQMLKRLYAENKSVLKDNKDFSFFADYWTYIKGRTISQDSELESFFKNYADYKEFTSQRDIDQMQILVTRFFTDYKSYKIQKEKFKTFAEVSSLRNKFKKYLKKNTKQVGEKRTAASDVGYQTYKRLKFACKSKSRNELPPKTTNFVKRHNYIYTALFTALNYGLADNFSKEDGLPKFWFELLQNMAMIKINTGQYLNVGSSLQSKFFVMIINSLGWSAVDAAGYKLLFDDGVSISKSEVEVEAEKLAKYLSEVYDKHDELKKIKNIIETHGIDSKQAQEVLKLDEYSNNLSQENLQDHLMENIAKRVSYLEKHGDQVFIQTGAEWSDRVYYNNYYNFLSTFKSLYLGLKITQLACGGWKIGSNFYSTTQEVVLLSSIVTIANKFISGNTYFTGRDYIINQ